MDAGNSVLKNMDSMLEMKVGKTTITVQVHNIIEQIPDLLKKGTEYKAYLVRVDAASDDDKKGLKLYAYWRISTKKMPGPSRVKIPKLQLVKGRS